MAKTQRMKPEEVVLVKGGQRKTVRTADDVVKAKFDGWRVEKAGARSVVENPGSQSGGQKSTQQ